MKIDKLTPEQVGKLDFYRERWLEIGLSVAATDKSRAETAVRLAYKEAGLTPPRIIIWLRSPYEGAIGSALLCNFKAQVGAQVGDPVWAQVRDQVGAQVQAQVVAQVREQVRAQVGAQVREQVRDQVWAQVGAQVWEQVRDQAGNACYGLHDAGGLGFYEYFSEICGLEVCKKLDPIAEAARSCGWWWPFQGAVILTEKPIFLHRDAELRLHGDGQLAIEYPDGWGVYASHGVRLPEKYGKTKIADWKPEWLVSDQNAELRMVLIRAIGYDRICQELNAKKIDTWREYELLKIENVDVEPILLCKMTCPSTGKIHALRVPPDTTSARAAITLCNHGIDPEQFIYEA